jgi:hypothetical protein
VAVHSTGFFAVPLAVAVVLVGASLAPVLAVGASFFRLAALFEAGFLDALCCATAAVPMLVTVSLVFILRMVLPARLVRA